ncbi:hypothetical protein [Streptomyces sp. NPDC059076]|uniref:hypothetical protein n=1 Tax=unclassified Streptomyces TaxID=2593676 RepID=UPI00367F268E
MSRWIVLATPLQGVSTMNCDTKIAREVEGTEDDALDALLSVANTFTDKVKVRRREVFRVSDRSYFIRIRNRISTYAYMIQIAALVSDSDQPGAGVAEPADAVPE